METKVLRVHAASDLIRKDNYIDPAKWSPRIYNFRHYFRLADRESGKTFRAEAWSAATDQMRMGMMM